MTVTRRREIIEDTERERSLLSSEENLYDRKMAESKLHEDDFISLGTWRYYGTIEGAISQEPGVEQPVVPAVGLETHPQGQDVDGEVEDGDESAEQSC